MLSHIGFDNRISSFFCGKNVWYNFCTGYGGECGYRDILSGAGFHKNNELYDFWDWGNHDNKLSSVKIGPYDAGIMGAVTLYRNHHCKGKSARLFWNPEDPEGGQYY